LKAIVQRHFRKLGCLIHCEHLLLNCIVPMVSGMTNNRIGRHRNRSTLSSSLLTNLVKMEKFITNMRTYLPCLLTSCFYWNWMGRNCLLHVHIETESEFSKKNQNRIRQMDHAYSFWLMKKFYVRKIFYRLHLTRSWYVCSTSLGQLCDRIDERRHNASSLPILVHDVWSSYTMCGQFIGSVAATETGTVVCSPSYQKFRYVIVQGSHATPTELCLMEVYVYARSK